MLIFLLYILLFIFAVQMAFFAFAAYFKTDKVTDLSYGLTFILVAWFTLLVGNSFNPLSFLITILVTIWGLRLAAYLFIRILKTGRDKRFDDIREKFLPFLRFWVFQALSIFIILLPHLVFFFKTAEARMGVLTFWGALIWLLGLLIETTADMQKYKFRGQPENKGKWISSGLWRYSRHPNYFGEMLCWWGLFFIIIPYLSGFEFLTILGPLYITVLLLFISGIPPLEKIYEEKFGQNPDYKRYKEKTNLLLPFPQRIKGL